MTTRPTAVPPVRNVMDRACLPFSAITGEGADELQSGSSPKALQGAVTRGRADGWPFFRWAKKARRGCSNRNVVTRKPQTEDGFI